MNTGLKGYPAGCGWFCRRLHDVKDVVDFVAPSIGTRIDKILAVFGISEDFAFRTAELSLQDQAILDEWYNLKFQPWVKNVSSLFSSISIQKTAIEKVTIINELQSQLCLVEFYHELVQIPFLTAQGKEEMKRLISEFSTAFSEELAIELSKYKTNEVASSLPFKKIAPIITEEISGFTKYKCFQYVLTRIDPVDETPIDVIDPIETPIDTDITNQIDTSNPVVTTTETKKSGFPWLLLLAGFVGYKVLK